MAKAKKAAKKHGGPFVAAAVFCENILQDKDDALSAIRIFDRINLTIAHDAPPDVPSKKHRLPVPVAVLLIFKSGDVPGDHNLRLFWESPSGKKTKVFDQAVSFSPPADGGASIRLTANLLAHTVGLHWLNVVLDGKRVAKTPLVIAAVRAQPPSPATGSGTL